MKKVVTDTLYAVLVFDEFGACVAAAYDPRLRGRPYVVVRQAAESHRSAVWSVSPAARGRGVRNGMPVQVVQRRWKEMEIVAYDAELHHAACSGLARFLLRYTPVVTVQKNGVCVLDLSRTPLARAGRLRQAAAEMQAAVSAASGLGRPACGMAAGRLVAKLLAARALPEGVGVCPPGGEEAVLAGCDTGALPGLSAGCRERLRKYGLGRVGQVQRLPRSALLERFGGEGERLYSLAHGIDIEEKAAAAPIEAETVLDRDTADRGLLLQYLRRTADRFCTAVKSRGAVVHRLLLAIQYTDRKRAQRTVSFAGGTDDYISIVRAVAEAFDGLCVRRAAIKSIILTGKSVDGATGQMELFESPWEGKQRLLGEKIVAVRRKMDFDAVFSGGDYGVYKLAYNNPGVPAAFQAGDAIFL